jgi:hypothetical protein
MATRKTAETAAPAALPENMNGRCLSCGDALTDRTGTARHMVRVLNEERCGVTTHDGACFGAHMESCEAIA